MKTIQHWITRWTEGCVTTWSWLTLTN